jgi:dTDP-4-dehydrorhamnose 3,5-epimerase
MKVENTPLDGVKLIMPNFYEDYRGTNFEAYNEAKYRDEIPYAPFVVDSISTSRKHTLRGIHGDDRTTKLISCLYGTIYYIIINRDPESKQYNHWFGITLSDRNKHQVLIPPKFGNGHLVMSEEAVFSYKLNAYYDRASQFTIKWNDPMHNFFWPIKNPILSERDA